MDDLYFSKTLSNGCALCIALLSDREVQAAGPELGDPRGYFLYERQFDGQAHTQTTVIARVVSEDAVMRLSRILCME